MKSYSLAAKKFYDSPQWEKTRKAYRALRHGICERCGKKNANIVHHKQYLNDERLKDTDYTLNFENLELLCIDCHNREHFEKFSPTQEGLMFDANGQLIKRDKERRTPSD